VNGNKELIEKIGRNDPCPCGSGRRFQELLHVEQRFRRIRPASLLSGSETAKRVSGTWDSACRVEITRGPDAPNGTPVESFTDVPRNWSITKPDRLCYRRASSPDNCDSGMTQWKT
jgi:hypothetical protein